MTMAAITAQPEIPWNQRFADPTLRHWEATRDQRVAQIRERCVKKPRFTPEGLAEQRRKYLSLVQLRKEAQLAITTAQDAIRQHGDDPRFQVLRAQKGCARARTLLTQLREELEQAGELMRGYVAIDDLEPSLRQTEDRLQSVESGLLRRQPVRDV